MWVPPVTRGVPAGGNMATGDGSLVGRALHYSDLLAAKAKLESLDPVVFPSPYGYGRPGQMANAPWVEDILKDVEYLDWDFRVAQAGEYVTMRANYNAKDSEHPEGWTQRGNSARLLVPLETYMYTDQARKDNEGRVIRSVWHLIQWVMSHERSEFFKYRGVPVFHEHTGIEWLIAAREQHLTQVEEPRTLMYDEVEEAVKQIQYRNWKFYTARRGDYFTVRAHWWASDSDEDWQTAEEYQFGSLTTLIPEVANLDTIPRIVYDLIGNTEEHEASERLKYKGVPIFHYHTGLPQLADARANHVRHLPPRGLFD